VQVALIRRDYITSLDGINRFIALLAEGLVRLGHEVILASWCYGSVSSRDLLSHRFMQVHGLDVEIPIYTLEERPCSGYPWVRILLKWWLRGRGLLVREGVDVALVNGALPLRFKPKVAVAHGPILNWSPARRLVQRALYSTFDRVVCVSEEARRQCERAGILECSEVIPLPIKLELYEPLDLSRRRDLVVHIGTRPIKNPGISIKAVEELRRRGLNLELAIVGSRRHEVEVLAREKDFVRTLFDIDEREKISILCSAKALILPSSAETFSYVTLEAMACGTPVVVSSAVPEEVVADRFNGIRVGSFDPRDYASALERLLLDEELWLRVSRNGLEFVRQFDHIRIARRYEELLRDLVERSEQH